MRYGDLSEEEKMRLNELLSRTTIRSDGTIDGQATPVLADLMGVRPAPVAAPEQPVGPSNYVKVGSTGEVRSLDYASPRGQRTVDVQETRRIAYPDGRTRVLEQVRAADPFGGSGTWGQERWELADYANPAKQREMAFRKAQLAAMSPEEKAFQEARGRARGEGSVYDKELAKERAKAEVSREMAGIPGTAEHKRVMEQEGAQKKATQRYESAVAQLDKVGEFLKKAEGMVDYGTAGLMGAATSWVPQTKAKDLSKVLQSIKANIGFDRLQRMREESPTGGALGQVAVQELNFLQSVEGSLDQDQSPQQLKDTLRQIRESYGRLVDDLKANPPDWTGQGTPKQTNLTNRDAEALMWAQRNPNDPRSAKILQRLGAR
jgi:hypothetical protein